jgi:tryptophan halogenase
MFDDTRDFIQAHFFFAPRVDTPFWRATKELQLGENIQQKVRMYRAGLPVNQPSTDESNYYGNLDAEFRNFWTNGSYYCVFTGLGLVPDHVLPALLHRPESSQAAEAHFRAVADRGRELAETLPSNLEYLRALHGVTT